MEVRTLEWTVRNEINGQTFTASAMGIGTFYKVSGTPGDWTLTSPGLTCYVHTPDYETQKAAMRAAQVDFERRIRAELSSQS